jgi:hypothetical protein
MLPPGHIAAGYLTAEIVLRTFNFDFDTNQIQNLLIWGAVFGFIPDLDFFLAFAKQGKMRIDNDVANHRKFISHAPLLWLAVGVVIFVFAPTDFVKVLAVLLWLCTWSHFILDAEWGIMWLWPFSKKLYPFSTEFYTRKYQSKRTPTDLRFWHYWLSIIKEYFLRPQGLIEIVIIITGLTYFLINHF